MYVWISIFMRTWLSSRFWFENSSGVSSAVRQLGQVCWKLTSPCQFGTDFADDPGNLVDAKNDIAPYGREEAVRPSRALCAAPRVY